MNIIHVLATAHGKRNSLWMTQAEFDSGDIPREYSDVIRRTFRICATKPNFGLPWPTNYTAGVLALAEHTCTGEP